MSGRVLALPLFISIVVLVRLLESRRAALGMAAALLAFIAWNPVAPPKAGTSAYRAYPQNENFIDTRWYVAGAGAGLLRWRPGLRLPDDEWYQAGVQMRNSPQRVFVGGAAGVAIGYAGFGAGPGKFIIDRVGLSDPLLARLPAYTPSERMRYKSGHFQRFIPEGYVESVERDTNVLANRGLRNYYGALRNVTRGPLFRSDRFKDIWRLNLGYYDAWLRDPTSPGDLPAAPR
jgi:arabinofuranosyltransferase